MKYIRTTSGRIISYDENADEIDKPMILKSKSNIIKQADSIEELCDEFVITCSNNYEYKEFYPCLATYTKIEEHKNSNEHTIFGAIWTDKGLIYVAKLNDKGVLELI